MRSFSLFVPYGCMVLALLMQKGSWASCIESFGVDNFEWNNFDVCWWYCGTESSVLFCMTLRYLRICLLKRILSVWYILLVCLGCSYICEIVSCKWDFSDARLIVKLISWVQPVFLNAHDDKPSLMKGPVLHLVELHFLMAGTNASPAILEDVRNDQLAWLCSFTRKKSTHPVQ